MTATKRLQRATDDLAALAAGLDGLSKGRAALADKLLSQMAAIKLREAWKIAKCQTYAVMEIDD